MRQREDRTEPDELDEAPHLRRHGAKDDAAASVLTQRRKCPHAGEIAEAHLAEVEHERQTDVHDDVVHQLLQLRRDGEVEIAGQSQRRDVAAVLEADLEQVVVPEPDGLNDGPVRRCPPPDPST